MDDERPAKRHCTFPKSATICLLPDMLPCSQLVLGQDTHSFILLSLNMLCDVGNAAGSAAVIC